MSHKYRAEVFRTDRISNYDRIWCNTWFCREFAQRDIHSIVTRGSHARVSLTTRIQGLNMRNRYIDEMAGMAKFGSLLLPDNLIDVDSTSIWIESVMGEDGKQITPARETYSLLLFYIKYLAVQMKDRVDFERVCKTLIRKKHRVFRSIPDQQLGTALYFYAYVRYPKEMRKFRTLLSSGSGPGTAMRSLANLEEKAVGVPVEAAKFYWAVVDEWSSLFKKELRHIVDYHVKEYERFWYLPLIIQDVYANVYDGDGKFDNVEYSEDEW